MAFSLTKEFVILCEGPADQRFLEKLLEKRKVRKCDIPEHKELGGHYGSASLGRMVRSLAGDPGGYAKLKGILVVTDSGDDPATTFKRVCEKLTTDGPYDAPNGFITPTGPYQITPQPPGHAPIAIMLIPEGRPGALETLCVESVVNRKPWLRACVDQYLSCGRLDVLNWPPEKRDQARMQCVIAGLNREDPNKGLAYLFSITPPIIHWGSVIFTPIVEYIKHFCDEAENQSRATETFPRDSRRPL
jgi:hypothetical protein